MPVEPESPESHHQTSKLSQFLKVFLISVALILLGVLIGVLSAKFVQPPASTAPQNNTQTPVDEQSLTPIEEESIVNLPEKLFEIRNSNAGVYSYDLYIPGDWTVLSEEQKSGDISLSFKKEDLFLWLMYNQDLKPTTCLTAEEIAPAKTSYVRYSEFADLAKGDLSWRIIKSQSATESATYLVCQKSTQGNYTSLTSAGYITFGSETKTELTEKELQDLNSIIAKIEMVTTTATPSAKAKTMDR